MLVIVPIIFIAATTPVFDKMANYDEESRHGGSGEIYMDWDGNSGCGYIGDFSFTITSGTLVYVDLDPEKDNIQNYFDDDEAEIWNVGTPTIITMLPKSGYTGPGFYYTCDVDLYFSDQTVENVTWTFFIEESEGPYIDPCY